MIALLAAVPQETQLLRADGSALVEESVHGLTFYRGRFYGKEVCLTHSGIGKAAAATATATLLLHCQPEALWLFGCGGAYPNSGLGIGDLVAADSELFGDEGVATANGFEDLAAMGLPMRATDPPTFNCWPTDTGLTDWATSVIPAVRRGPFVTVSSCTGTTARALELETRTGGICENMEGAAVALACQQFSVPMLEIRGISNLVEDRDTSRWNLPKAMNAAQEAVLTLLKSVAKG